jgi:hypothetical protein
MAAAATPTTNDGYQYCILIVIDDQDNNRIAMPLQIQHPTSNIWLGSAHVQGWGRVFVD